MYFLTSLLTGGVFMTTLPTVFQTCHFIINFIYKSFIMPQHLKRLFDHVINTNMALKYNKLPRGVLNNYLPGYYGETFFGKTFRNLQRMCSPILWLSNLMVCFSINMIPFVGPVLVVFLRGPKSGFKKHQRYFYLKGLTNAQVYYIWLNMRTTYFMFGVLTLFLEMTPIIGYLFVFTNTIGAACWAVDIEDKLYKQMLANVLVKEEGK